MESSKVKAVPLEAAAVATELAYLIERFMLLFVKFDTPPAQRTVGTCEVADFAAAIPHILRTRLLAHVSLEKAGPACAGIQETYDKKVKNDTARWDRVRNNIRAGTDLQRLTDPKAPKKRTTEQAAVFIKELDDHLLRIGKLILELKEAMSDPDYVLPNKLTPVGT